MRTIVLRDNPHMNEIGTSPNRGLPRIHTNEAEPDLSLLAEKPVQLPSRAIVSSHPETCPACGETDIMWGCDQEVTRTREEIHPLVWHESAWMADSHICRACFAGWIETDEPAPITWVRPYWIVT